MTKPWLWIWCLVMGHDYMAYNLYTDKCLRCDKEVTL